MTTYVKKCMMDTSSNIFVEQEACTGMGILGQVNQISKSGSIDQLQSLLHRESNSASASYSRLCTASRANGLSSAGLAQNSRHEEELSLAMVSMATHL